MGDLAGYVMVDEIGRGASGTVWRARQRAGDGRLVAVKRVRGNDAEAAMRIAEEVRTLAALDHPHVVPILECVADGGDLAIVMAYAAGGSLADRLDRFGRLDWREAASLLAPIADALGSAHRRGVVHRDVKPANILLTSDGEPLLADFGMARSSEIVGTPGYLAPEVAEGAVAGPLADVYAVGAVAYQCVAGQLPTGPAGNDVEAGVDVEVDPAGRPHRTHSPRLDEMDLAVPAAFADVVARAMARSPHGRLHDAATLAAELRGTLVAESRGSQAGASHDLVAGATHAPPLVRRSDEVGRSHPLTQSFGPAPPTPAPADPTPVPWVRVALVALLLLLTPPAVAWLMRSSADPAPPGSAEPVSEVAKKPAHGSGAPSPSSQSPAWASRERTATASLTARTVRVPPPATAGVNNSSTVPSAVTVTARAEPSPVALTEAVTLVSS